MLVRDVVKLRAWEGAVQVEAAQQANELFPNMKSKPKATNTSQVQALIAGVEAEEVPPEEDDPDADFAGAPLLGGGDEDEWETWCTEHLEPG